MYTTGHIERETGISERTIVYYNGLGLLSLKKKHGKMVVTDEDLILLMKILTLKMTNRNLKKIRHLGIEKRPLSELVKELEDMIVNIVDLVERLENYKENLNSIDHFLLLRDLNSYVQKYVNSKNNE